MLLNLKTEMHKHNVTCKMIADEIDLRIQAIILKINGKSEFKISEAIKIRDKFFPGFTLEYLFSVCQA